MERNVRRNVVSTEIVRLERDLLDRLQNDSSGIGCTNAGLSPDQELCQKLLADGKPKAFIELFNITTTLKIDPTHPDDIVAGIVNPVAEAQKTLKHKETLKVLCANLVAAEVAARTDDEEKSFSAHSGIAKVFAKTCYFAKSIEYYSKSLAAAVKTKKDANITQAKYDLGKMHWKLRDTIKARESYEECITIARKYMDQERIVLASRDLLEIYWHSAEVQRTSGDFPSSIDYFQKAKSMAELCGDGGARAEALYKIGLLYAKLRDLENSTKHQMEYLQHACSVGNKSGECKARASLAEAYELCGDVQTALNHLQAYVVAARSLDQHTQARGYCLLGMLHQRHNKRDLALDFFEQYFDMARALKDPDYLDIARVNISITTCRRAQQQQQRAQQYRHSNQ